MIGRRHYWLRNGALPTGWPARDMHHLHRDWDYLLGGTRGPIRSNYPPLNAWIDDESLVVTAEIAGVDPEDIQLSVENDTLILSGMRPAEELPETAKVRRRERGSGKFERKLELPFTVDADAVEATVSNGILQIVLPRLPEEKPKKIAVNAV